MRLSILRESARARPEASGVRSHSSTGDCRIVYATDLHLHVTNPSCRTGSYPADILRKAAYIYEYAATNEADLVIWGGDTFNSPQLPPRVTNPFFAMTANYLRRGGNILFAVGEHDVEGRNASRFREGCLGVVEIMGASLGSAPGDEAPGAVAIGVDPSKPGGAALFQYAFDRSRLSVACLPCPDSNDEARMRESTVDSLTLLASLGHIQLIVLHHSIHTEKVPFPYVHADDLPISPSQVVLCGHIHTPPKHLPPNVLMPGSAARTTAADKDRPPMLLDIALGVDARQSSVSRVPLPVPEDRGEDPFNAVEGRDMSQVVEDGRRILLRRSEQATSLSAREQMLERFREEVPQVRTVAEECFDEAGWD